MKSIEAALTSANKYPTTRRELLQNAIDEQNAIAAAKGEPVIAVEFDAENRATITKGHLQIPVMIVADKWVTVGRGDA